MTIRSSYVGFLSLFINFQKVHMIMLIYKFTIFRDLFMETIIKAISDFNLTVYCLNLRLNSTISISQVATLKYFAHPFFSLRNFADENTKKLCAVDFVINFRLFAGQEESFHV